MITFFALVALSFGQNPTTPPPVTPPTAPTTTTSTPPPLPVHALFFGAGFNTSTATQRPVGVAAYLQQVSSTTYAFARYDLLGVNKNPYGIQTVVTAGVCEVLHQFGPFFTAACLDGGTTVAGTNVGGAIGADGTLGFRFTKSGNWGFAVQGGIVKTALSSSVNPIRAGFFYGF